jgi:uncharacterized protein DUF4388
MSMSQRRGTITDNLNNVIQVIQLGRKTGVLTVERGDEATLEFGEITFVYGQITYAHIGELDGQIAVNVLCSWGLCRFLFTPSGSERSTGPIPSQPHASSRTTAPLKEIYANTSSPISESRDYLSSDHTGIGQPRPFRTKQIDDALALLEQAGLSRPYRRLLLLIDGQRTPLELVRLTGRPLEEIQRLLYDLERIGVISQ